MNITSLKIKDLGNIEYFEATLGIVSLILGANDKGKSNVLRVFRWVFNGGNDPGLLRDGCDEGWAEFTFSNGYRAHKRLWVKEKGDIGYDLKVLTPEGAEPPGGAKTLLDKWLPKSSFDPDYFIDLSKKKRAEWLLEHVHLEFTGAEINAALNPQIERPKVVAMTERAKAFLLIPVNQRASAPAPKFSANEIVSLERFEELYCLRYSQRTELNRIKEQIDGTIATLSRGLENIEEKDWGAKRDQIQKELTETEGTITALQSRLRMESSEKISAERAASRNRSSALRDATAAYVGSVRNFSEHVEQFSASDGTTPGQMTADIRDLAGSVEDFILAVHKLSKERFHLVDFVSNETALLNEHLTSQTAELESSRQALSVDFGIAQARADEQQRSRGVRDTIVEQQEYVHALEYTEADLTRSIRELEKLKTMKLQAVNIPGFNIRYQGNEPIIEIEGRQFDRLNEESQIIYAIKFMRLANPELSFVIVQGNAIDNANLEWLTETAERAKLQLVIERCIAGQPLRIMPAGNFLEAAKAADQVLAEGLESI